MKIISVINYKGGVGKTTVTANLGALLAQREYRVLLIDLDPQASLTFCFFSPESWTENLAPKLTIKQWFEEFLNNSGDTELSELILNLGKNNRNLELPKGALDLIASHLRLINVDLSLAIEFGRTPESHFGERFLEIHSLLANGLSSASLPNYDFVLIDCPPNLNIVTRNAIIASDHLLIPSRADYLSTLGIHYLIERVGELVQEYNSYSSLPSSKSHQEVKIHPSVLGVVFTMVQLYAGKPYNVNQEFMRRTKIELQDRFKIPAFATVTRLNQKAYTETTSSGIPLALSRNVPEEVTDEFRQLASEFLAKLEMNGDLHD